jgi:hypothetical protein
MLKHDEFNRYMELYSEYVERSVNLHNYHYLFVKNKSHEAGEKVREQLREMSNLCDEIKRKCLAAQRENKENVKLKKQLAKDEAIAYKLANPKKSGPKGPWKHKK